MNRARRRHDAHFVRDLRERHRQRRPAPTSVLWWWRWEICGAVVLAGTFGALVRGMSWPLAAAAILLGAGVVIALPVSRSWLTRRLWAVVDQHRIRTALAEAAVHSGSGRLPTILGARVVPGGERVWVWCPAGLAFLDLLDVSDALAAACWATSVHIHHRRDHSNLVVIDVIRTPQQRCAEHRWEGQS